MRNLYLNSKSSSDLPYGFSLPDSYLAREQRRALLQLVGVFSLCLDSG